MRPHTFQIFGMIINDFELPRGIPFAESGIKKGAERAILEAQVSQNNLPAAGR